ncbi:glycosyltransferase 87 family protein [Corynebacterium sp.]|uniref:glycosyltransferase 87 family protein n=1 Tax=Corynebacterium sp. TaxID=1720 RepID=UPI0026DF1E14|nr:glycosyltransferase 87 family protein [Corynebacterium sp.]MDO5511200.1 glycosyltransferase 87 family protein [Corynebacterium sp.]
MIDAPPAARPLTVVLAVVASVAVVLTLLIDAGPTLRYAIDIDVYRAGAQAFLDGDNLYTRDYRVGGTTLPFTYPPLAALLFVPLTWVPYGVALVTWTVASVVLLWWCLVIVVRHAVPGAHHRVIATWILPLALLSEPVRETLAFGQINIILMALVLVDTLTRRPWLPRGVLIGLAAAIKLTPAVFILVFLVRRQWRDAAVTFAFGVGFTLAAALVSWGNSWTYWLETLTDTGRIGGEAYASNQSIRGVLARLAEPGERADSLLWLVLVIGALGLVVAAMWRARTMLATVLLASTVALVCSPVSWSHHWVWLIPLAVTLLLGPGRTLGVVVLLAVATSPHWLLPNDHGVEHAWPWWAQLVGSSYLLVTLAVVVAATISPRVLAGRR